MVLKIIKKFWQLIKICLCICLLTGTFYYGYNYLNDSFRTKGVEYNESFHNLPENSMDIIVLGSSHAQYSYVPSFVYQNTGLYSYVLGSACQPLKVSYEMLKEALKTQSPELIILEVYTATPLKLWCMADSCYVLAEYQMRGEEKQNVINMLPEEKAELYKNEFLVNHNNWKDLNDFKEILNQPDREFIDPTFGFVCQDPPEYVDNWWYPNVFKETVDVELDEEDLTALNNIYNLCNENNIEILLYMMPMDGLDVENQSYRYKVWQWAEERNIKYLDFVDLAEKLDYKMRIHNDGAHSLINGSSYISDYLSEYVANEYKFNNHNNDDFLNTLYNKYVNMYSYKVFKSEPVFSKYKNRLEKYSGLLVVGIYNHNEQIDTFVRTVCNEEEYIKNRYVIYKNEIIASGDDYLWCEVNGRYIEIVGNSLRIDNETMNCNRNTIVIFDENGSGYVVK
ncbi:MAG: hypothetical protein Q4B60_00465 [Erysipelotrichaceae bacterium]|nr:hypothetical protein [Erysipelotrichaceae bacterium]